MSAIRSSADVEMGLRQLVDGDARLRGVVERAGGVPLRLSTPDFAGLAGIVVSQQVSKASAEAIHGRLRTLVRPLDAATLLACDETVFRQAGLSRPKQRTLLNVAQAVVAGTLDLSALSRMEADEAMAAMTEIKGIGPWTAEIFLLFCGGHPDIFPAGDLALQEAVREALGLDERPGDRQLREIAAAWSPWRGVAARLFWAYYRVIKGGRDALPV